MRVRTIASFALSSITARAGRSLALAGGVSLCIALFVAMSSLSDGYARLVRQPLEALAADVTVQRPGAPKATGAGGRLTMPPANAVLTPEERAIASSLPQVAATNAALLLWDRSSKGFTVVMGIDPGRSGSRIGPAVVQEWVSKGHALERDGDLLLEEHFAKLSRLQVGDRFDIGGREMTVSGLVKIREGGALIPANAFVTLSYARELAGLPEESANVIFAKLKKGADIDQLRAQLGTRLAGAVITSSDSIGEMMRGFSLISGKFSSFIGLLALCFAVIACHRLITGSVQERRYEFGVMQAVGWQHKDINEVLMFESAFLGVLSAVIGILLGYALASFMGDLMLASQGPVQLTPLPAGIRPSGGEGDVVHLPLVNSWATNMVALATALAAAVIGGWHAASKMTRTSVMDALREP
ncbi:MAG: ABC transporter permease [Solidesulfovibrio sp.]|uniref:ABC transporter permease n=1 Tax=Solidesulfovibrio sp. TaxID=2910990 RepID=UPI00315813EC